MVLKLNFVKKTGLILILFFPILIAVIKTFSDKQLFSLNIYYFFVFFLLGGGLLLFSAKLFVVKSINLIHYLTLAIILLFAFSNFNGLRYSMPIFFIVYLIFLVRISEYKEKWPKSVIVNIAFIYLAFSVLNLFINSSFENQGRFSGFTNSATTYSIFIIALIILLLRSKIPAYSKYIIYLIGFFLIGITLTRLNLFFYLLLPALLLISKTSRTKRGLFLLSYIVLLNLVYPVYSYISNQNKELIKVRYADGRDASFGLRLILFNEVYENWQSSPTLNKYFGNGLENARLYVYTNHKIDLLPHNDFIRILNDFGLIPASLFFLWLFRLVNTNRTTFLLGCLYFLSFYHNMVYNLFIISLLILSSYYDPFSGKSKTSIIL